MIFMKDMTFISNQRLIHINKGKILFNHYLII